MGLRSDQIKTKLFEDEDKALADIVKVSPWPRTSQSIVNLEQISSCLTNLSSSSSLSCTNQTRFISRGFLHKSSQSTRFQTQQSSTNYRISMPCYGYGASGHKHYECNNFVNRLQSNNCNRTGQKALVCCQPRKLRRGRTTFQPRVSTHTQGWTPNFFQRQRVLSGRFYRFPRHGVSSPEQSNYTDESESTSSVLTVHPIQNVSPIQYTVEVNGTPISMKVDSGSCYSLLNSNWWNRLGRLVLRRGAIPEDVSRNLIPVLKIANVEVRLKDQSKQLRVVLQVWPDTAFQLERKWIAEFHLLSDQNTQPEQVPTSLTSLLTEFSDLFDTSTLPPI